MEIKKYKYLGSSKYKIFIDDEEYIIYEDIIVKNNILLKKEITKEELEFYLKENTYYEALYKSIKYIGIKMRSKKELIKYLSKTYDKLVVDKVIVYLVNNNLINDRVYVRAYINDSINLKNIGPFKIEKELVNMDIDKDIIINELDIYTKDIELEKIGKIIEKEIKLNRNKSLYMLKIKIMYNLINLGFHKEYIDIVLNDISIDDKDIYKKEYDKLYKKLCNKYDKDKLDYIIKQKLYQKGFRKE